MSWLHLIDLALFRFINLRLSNGVCDRIMPQFSSNGWYVPVLLALGLALLWKGGARGRLLVLSLALIIGLGDTLVINPLKKAVGRPRPFMEVSEAKLLVGRGRSSSLPSSHTATWFAATVIAAAYYRRSWRVMLPVALSIGFSRVYLGAHYPSDVLLGALLGMAYAGAGLWLLNRLWQFAGRRWFPLWYEQMPGWIPRAPDAGRLGAEPSAARAQEVGNQALPSSPSAPTRNERQATAEAAIQDRQWVRLGYVLIAAFFVGRLWYLTSGRIELSEDEAYQWVWSKHLALSYYSKPPLIALLHYLGTALFGDTAFGVRFTPPLISAVVATLLLRVFAQEAGGRIGLLMVLMVFTTPLLAAGSILLTIDPPLVLFWCAAMGAGWRGILEQDRIAPWIWMGIWLGLAFLSKYSALFFLPSLALFFVLWPPARVHLKRPGPWVALLPLAIATLPVVIWNTQHGWVTIQHVSENAQLGKSWHPTGVYFLEFLVGEFGLLNPVFFVGMLIAVVRFWPQAPRRPFEYYLFAMGAPVFFGYWLYTLHSRVHPNWIAPAVVPLLGLTLLYWERRWREGCRPVVPWLRAGLALGTVLVLLGHDTALIHQVTRLSLPAKMDPLTRVRGISEIARIAGEERRVLEKAGGTETFIIASHYGLTGQITFYLPEARLGLPGSPLVYVKTSRGPKNQFYFWPEYRYRETRKGQNAVFIRLSDKPEPPPQDLLAEFESVTDLGYREIKAGHEVLHRLQIFACKNLL
ncbi:MAG TPA: glycosyltransferase family 39 protein [Verrucomicrobiae bacterium]|nr:glycosyltransferase family 39 protein [Verrucomicrobiae bacterium]